jgi:hypothetical protein
MACCRCSVTAAARAWVVASCHTASTTASSNNLPRSYCSAAGGATSTATVAGRVLRRKMSTALGEEGRRGGLPLPPNKQESDNQESQDHLPLPPNRPESRGGGGLPLPPHKNQERQSAPPRPIIETEAEETSDIGQSGSSGGAISREPLVPPIEDRPTRLPGAKPYEPPPPPPRVSHKYPDELPKAPFKLAVRFSLFPGAKSFTDLHTKVYQQSTVGESRAEIGAIRDGLDVSALSTSDNFAAL